MEPQGFFFLSLYDVDKQQFLSDFMTHTHPVFRFPADTGISFRFRGRPECFSPCSILFLYSIRNQESPEKEAFRTVPG